MCLNLDRGAHDIFKDVPIDTELATVQSAKFNLQFIQVHKKNPSKIDYRTL
jgi:hypothetical protein